MLQGLRRLATCAALALFFASSPRFAIAADAAAPAKAAEDAVVAGSDDIVSLIAPIALYPDPILALILQSSTLPLEVVQAERFLQKRAKEKTLQPDPDWDSAIIGLLNYPKQLSQMAEYLDWTEEVGNAVIDDLDAVQSAIQDIRLAAYYAGWLKSTKQQTVTLEDGIVRISPADAKTVSIPEYDPAALLTALDEVEEAEEAADAAAPAATAAAAAPAQGVAPAPAGAVVTDPGHGAYASYDVTPPVIAYGEPQDTFWNDAATFAGGAVVGGLLGWALTEAFDDDDDDWEDWWDDNDWDNDEIQDRLRDRQEYRQNAATDRREHRQQAADERREFRGGQIEDRKDTREERRKGREGATGDRRETREDKAALAREQLSGRQEARLGKGSVAAAQPGRAKRDVALPGAGKQPGVADKVRQRSGVQTAAAATGRPAVAKVASPQQKYAATDISRKASGQGIAAGAGPSQRVRKEATRGARSRGGGSATPASFGRSDQGGGKTVKRQRGGGGSGIAAGHNRGGAAKADGARGRASREGARGGGGGGRRNR